MQLWEYALVTMAQGGPEGRSGWNVEYSHRAVPSSGTDNPFGGGPYVGWYEQPMFLGLLRQLGSDGWELVAVSNMQYTFKRPLGDPRPFNP